MEWLINNWSLLVVLAALLGIVFYYGKKFTSLPSDEQLNKVKQWLLYAVIMAEKEYQNGTGKLKLASVYSKFIVTFPSLVPIISFELFSALVDKALVVMRKEIENNKSIANYITGEQNEKK